MHPRPNRIQIILNRSTWPIDRTLTSTITPGQSEPGSNGNKGVFNTLQVSRTGASPSNGDFFRRSYPSSGDTISELWAPLTGQKLCLLLRKARTMMHPVRIEFIDLILREAPVRIVWFGFSLFVTSISTLNGLFNTEIWFICKRSIVIMRISFAQKYNIKYSYKIFPIKIIFT